jgi:hypothetical protein
MTDVLNAETIKQIVTSSSEAAAIAAVRKFVQDHPPAPQPAEIPAPLKWAAAIASALLTAGVTGACFWGVSTLNDLQLTVTRIDERQQRDTTIQDIEKLDARVAALEKGERKP